MKLSVISFKNNTEHLHSLIGKVGLSWKTNSFDGCIKVIFFLKVHGLCIINVSGDVYVYVQL